MSALVDENTVAVTYDYKRGESRTKWSKADSDARKHADEHGFTRPREAGDCVDCHQCVTVCPTGIDIRNGIQLECVNCTACIDACDEVMDKVGLDRGLIRYSSLNAIEQGTSRIFTRRIKAYLVVWVVFVAVVGVLFAMRSDLDVVLLRQPKSTWTTMAQGTANFYALNIINKTSQDLPYEIAVVSPSGYSITPLNLPTMVKAEQKMEGRLVIIRSSQAQRTGDETIRLEVRSRGAVLRTVETTFIGPQE
jgi:cytochrome c oxidase accessory protein FixG